MRNRSYLVTTLVFILAAACTKDYQIVQPAATPQYVIEGKISNLLGPYYVRITRSASTLGPDTTRYSGLDNAIGVLGAEVTITDDMGLTDTLRPIPQSSPRYDPPYIGDRGYYATTKMTGMPGHTYRLRVRIGSGTFEASAILPATVPAIDSVLLKKDPAADPTGFNGLAAFAYFKEPRDETDYYLLQLNRTYETEYDHEHTYNYAGGGIFPFYVFDDRTLPAYVDGMEVLTIVADGISSGRFQPYWIIHGDSVEVRLSSLTKGTYEYFSAVERQFLDDGNAYKPAPASAVGNISGGALGLFWGANISGKVVRP